MTASELTAVTRPGAGAVGVHTTFALEFELVLAALLVALLAALLAALLVALLAALLAVLLDLLETLLELRDEGNSPLGEELYSPLMARVVVPAVASA